MYVTPATYTMRMVRLMRNSSSVLSQVGGTAGRLEETFALADSSAFVDVATKAFCGWYRVKYGAPDTSQLNIRSEILGSNALLVAGMLSEFSIEIEQIIDVANILKLASSLLMTHGWIQGEPGSAEKGFDLLGAIAYGSAQYAHGALEYYSFAAEERLFHCAKDALGVHLGTAFIAQWNDTPGRDWADVVAALGMTADDLLRVKY